MKGRTALVTGGGSGIGAATARLFAREGALVILWGRRKDPLCETALSIQREGGQAEYACVDITDLEALAKTYQDLAGLGRVVDALVNAAGVVYRQEDSTRLEVANWQNVVEINLKGVYHTTHLVLETMLNRGVKGTIVNIASILAHRALAGHATYSASKAAVIAYTRVIALQVARHGIRANTISPGIIHTPMSYVDRPNFQELLPGMLKGVPLGRVGQPEDIAHAALFLSCSESDWITGQDLIIDGGASLD